MKTVLNIIKIVVLWHVIAFLGLLALGSLPSIAWIFALLLAAFIAPIKPWQALIKKYIKIPFRIIIIVALSISTLVAFPASEADTSKDTVNHTTPVSQSTTTAPIENTQSVNTTSTTEPTLTPSVEPTSEPTTEPPHVHAFSDATCTEPQICTECGEISGTAKGHDWTSATCMIPKTCTVCGTTTGNPAEHIWKAATCTHPKTCTNCGTTEGSANGHSWKSATCTDPKTCSVCGTTSGLTAGHNFSRGKCTTCGKADPDYSHETMVWIPTNGGTKYHTHAGCSNMEDPEQVTQSEAESRGFTPCKRCH